MYKNLMVHLPTERSARPAVDGAISLAKSCGAHLDAVAIGYETTSTVPFVMEGGAAVAAMFELEHERAMERAQAALAVFEIEAKGAKIDYGCNAIGATFAEAVATVGATARLYDLAIVSQGEPDRGEFDNKFPQELMLQTGGPMLMFPYTFRGAFKAARIGICWDGSRPAARALRDAMPLLIQADSVTTITLNASEVPTEVSPDQLAKHLGRSGLTVKTVSLEGDSDEIQPSLLSIATDESLDLLVMGGYGHSRLQETVFGGVTRAMFQSMTVPVLFSH
jgi:nucleotide-binding universal stress UspA family protein